MDRAREAELAYRQAFNSFSERVREVQALAAQPNADLKAMEAALLELEKAHVVYADRRDEWVKYLLPSSSLGFAGHESHQDCVRSIAKLLWESAGRPEGTAAQDWRKAEEIVKAAAAA